MTLVKGTKCIFYWYHEQITQDLVKIMLNIHQVLKLANVASVNYDIYIFFTVCSLHI